MNRTEFLTMLVDVAEPIWYLAIITSLVCLVYTLPWFRQGSKSRRALPWIIVGGYVVGSAILHFTVWS